MFIILSVLVVDYKKKKRKEIADCRGSSVFKEPQTCIDAFKTDDFIMESCAVWNQVILENSWNKYVVGLF